MRGQTQEKDADKMLNSTPRLWPCATGNQLAQLARREFLSQPYWSRLRKPLRDTYRWHAPPFLLVWGLFFGKAAMISFLSNSSIPLAISHRTYYTFLILLLRWSGPDPFQLASTQIGQGCRNHPDWLRKRLTRDAYPRPCCWALTICSTGCSSGISTRPLVACITPGQQD